ncbi:hypothetical protein Naga_100210g11 [Nannochloropsis gaditana]|uniref:Uncharacterized protein n=1 Tax=Nannochloropsis gaditana TaxID=72520 RepID=W7TTA7_9STRA|nr:hypothetical protein Naga_100210g11 [Nannochloropsis gaditana]
MKTFAIGSPTWDFIPMRCVVHQAYRRLKLNHTYHNIDFIVDLSYHFPSVLPSWVFPCLSGFLLCENQWAYRLSSTTFQASGPCQRNKQAAPTWRHELIHPSAR